MFSMVGEAPDGQAGVELCRLEQPDVVLLDLSMPVMDGLEALPHIIEAVPGVAVVILSGFTASAMAEQAIAKGAIGYLEKGVPASQLVRQLQSMLKVEPTGSRTS